MNLAINVQNASKQFGRNAVLRDLTLQVPEGVVYAILGENGAGKTTLIRSIMGYHRLDSGSIRVLEIDPNADPLRLRREVGYVSDQPALYDWMSVGELGWFTSGFYPAGYAERFSMWAEQFQLPKETKIKQLSKGMRSKAALASVLASDPKLLILDEPTSGLDPLVRRDFLESMVDLAATGKTVLLSSHQVHEVERVADYVAILADGKFQVAAPLEELKSSIRIVSFSLRDPLVPPQILNLGLNVVRLTAQGRQVQLVVRDCPQDLESRLASDSELLDLKVIRPSLEELYIAFTQPSSTPPWQEPTGRNRPGFRVA